MEETRSIQKKRKPKNPFKTLVQLVIILNGIKRSTSSHPIEINAHLKPHIHNEKNPSFIYNITAPQKILC